MLRKITLRCFRQHEFRTFTFTPGLNLLRGANEGGKTTILEAITYAIGGAVALPESLDKVVTWDHKESELSVELELQIAGVDYSVKRSKAGATLTSPSLEKPVTGQKEVSGFFAELLGGSAKTLGMLLMASQNGLQDVITAGHGEVSQLVQKIGQMDIVDGVIAQGDKELTLGNERVFADRVSQRTEAFNLAQQALVPEVAITQVEEFLTTAEAQVEEADKVVKVVWEPAMEGAASSLNAGIARNDHVLSLRAQHQTVTSEVARLENSIQQASTIARPDLSLKVNHEADLARYDRARQLVMLKDRVQRTMAARGTAEWFNESGKDDALTSLNTEVEVAMKDRDAARHTAMNPVVNPRLAELQAARQQVMQGDPFAEEKQTRLDNARTPYRVEEEQGMITDIANFEAQWASMNKIAARPAPVLLETCPTCKQKFADVEARQKHFDEEKLAIETARETCEKVQGIIKRRREELEALRSDRKGRDAANAEWGAQLERQTAAWRAEQLTTIDAERVKLEAERDVAQRDAMSAFQAKEQYVGQLTALVNKGYALSVLADEIEGNPMVTVNRQVWPVKIEWVGTIETPEKSESELRAALAQLDVDQGNYDRAQGLIIGLRESVTAQRTRLTDIEINLVEAQKDLPNLDELRAHYDRTSQGLSAARQALEDKRKEHSTLALRKADLVARSERAAQAFATAAQELETAKANLAELAFNNEAMKTFKLLKPKITEYMWSKCLNIISHYFSDMRDQVVKVTREGSEFMFNGRPASSLSGSGKDILAIAIRAALTRTFLPNVGFMTLDEPAHGSDEARTSRVLGFLAKSGFNQLILASHDPLSEAVADNIIYVTEAQ